MEKYSKPGQDILEAYQQSGLTVDEFIVAYLRDKGIENPEKVAAGIDSSFKKIDKNYEELKKCKAQGGNRQTFLRNITVRVLHPISVNILKKHTKSVRNP